MNIFYFESKFKFFFFWGGGGRGWRRRGPRVSDFFPQKRGGAGWGGE